MATNAVIQTVGAAGYVSLRVTQASHGLTGRVPVYYNTSTNLWTAAQANAGTTLGTHLAKVIDSNTLLIVQSGIFPDPTHGLTAGQYYFVSDSAAGTLTVTEPTAVGSFSNPMIYVTDANTYIVLGYRSSQTVNQSFNPLLNDGTAAAPSLAFSADTNTGIFRPGADQFSISTGGTERFRIESTGQIKAVYESQVGTDYNTTMHNGYFCRAWVNFNGTATQKTGTYTISGTTITVSITSHGLTTGNFAELDFASGDGVDGRYQVTVINANSYTVTNPVSGSTGGNVTQDAMVRASGNVSSITDNGTGDYTVNFTNAMPDANYTVVASLRPTADSKERPELVDPFTTTSVTVVNDDGLNNKLDTTIFCVAVFR